MQRTENGDNGKKCRADTVHLKKLTIYTEKLDCRFSCLSVCPQGEFVDDGTETCFSLGAHECCIKATTTAKKKNAIVHLLLLDGEKVPASTQ